MTRAQVLDGDVQLSLVASAGHAGFAATWLGKTFGLDTNALWPVLEQGSGVLVHRLDRMTAESAMPMLAAMGLHVALQPCDAAPAEGLYDVSLRAAASQSGRVVAALARLVDHPVTEESLAGVAGHVVSGLTLPRAERLCMALRKVSGVTVALSAQQTALYDLFATKELDETDLVDLRRQLKLFGCSLGGMSGALATGVEHAVLRRIVARFADLGLFGVNQAFQRHELRVIGRGDLPVQEFMDFVRTRPLAAAVAPRDMLRSLPLTVEVGLSRRAAEQFLFNYSAIGIHAVTRLVGTLPENL